MRTVTGSLAGLLPKGQTGLFLALSSVTGGNIVFHILAARALGPVSYGTLGALLTLLLGLVVPAGALQVSITAKVVELRSRGRTVNYVPMCLSFGAFGLVAAGLLTLSSPLIANFLHMDGLVDVVLIGLFIVPSLIGVVLRSVLLGSEKYGRLAFSLLLGNATRVLVGCSLFVFGGGVTTALIGTLSSEILAVVSMYICVPKVPKTVIPWKLTISFVSTFGGVAAFSGLWLLVGVDTFLVRHHLTATDAGLYAAVALAARSVLFLPQAAITSSLPKLAGPIAQAREHLVDLLLISLLTGLATTFALSIGATHVGPILLGPEFQLDQRVLLVLAAAAIWFGLLTALTNFHLARGNARHANRVWLGFAVLTTASWMVTPAPQTMAILVLVGGVAATVWASVPLLRLEPSSFSPTGPGPAGRGTTDLSVVVPFLNEGEMTSRTIDELLTAADDNGLLIEVLAVSDGSTDGGEVFIEQLEDKRVTVLNHHINRGKGEALRTGMTHSSGRLIAMLDGDGDIEPAQLLSMVSQIERIDCDAVIGSKQHPKSVVQTSAGRHVLTFSLWLVAKLLLGRSLPDSQVGAKVFQREVLEQVLPRTVETGYLFDLELLLVAQTLGYRRIVESPVVIASHVNSNIGLRAVCASTIDLFGLVKRMARRTADTTNATSDSGQVEAARELVTT